MNTLLILGTGYSAQALIPLVKQDGWRVIGTSRTAEKAVALSQQFGIEMCVFPSDALVQYLLDVTHILATASPTIEGDPFLPFLMAHKLQLQALQWAGYLSTIGVYAEADGGWIDETSATHSETPRIVQRLQAEAGWQLLAPHSAVFRLGGIYGPGRAPFDKILDGTAQRIIKAGHVFNRSHSDDIAGAVYAALHQPDVNGIFNVVDDEPASSHEVLTYAAQLLNVPPPPEVLFEQAELSLMAREFYTRNKRVKNERLKNALQYTLKYPSYREGLRACL